MSSPANDKIGIGLTSGLPLVAARSTGGTVDTGHTGRKNGPPEGSSQDVEFGAVLDELAASGSVETTPDAENTSEAVSADAALEAEDESLEVAEETLREHVGAHQPLPIEGVPLSFNRRIDDADIPAPLHSEGIGTSERELSAPSSWSETMQPRSPHADASVDSVKISKMVVTSGVETHENRTGSSAETLSDSAEVGVENSIGPALFTGEQSQGRGNTTLDASRAEKDLPLLDSQLKRSPLFSLPFISGASAISQPSLEETLPLSAGAPQMRDLFRGATASDDAELDFEPEMTTIRDGVPDRENSETTVKVAQSDSVPQKLPFGGMVAGFGLDSSATELSLASGGAVDFGYSELAKLDTSPVSSPVTSVPTGATAQAAAQQIARIAQAQPGGPVELALNPEELGRVKLTFTSHENTLVVNIVGERSDTIELMRRHIDSLNQEFKQIGYSSVSFSFAQSDGNGGQGDGSDSDSAHGGNLVGDEALSLEISPGETNIRGLVNGAGLDIRI